jgi:trimeric autotransporter adhesin
MRLQRLVVEDFGAVRRAEVELRPGLNVLHGPNDLGKSTLADAIRLGLLLPHTSTHRDPFVPWSGGQTPRVELTFETAPQRIWRVRKAFGKGSAGSAVLQASRDGRDFEDVARNRQVDGQLREVLGWGIAEPGGAGSGKGLPKSFLATALLSTQSDVSDVLARSLADDGIASGKDRIAAALQAAAQDPLFVRVLAEAQARRDEAYTDKGARKTARGSVLKVAADGVADARRARDDLGRQVADTGVVERDLEALLGERAAAKGRMDEASGGLVALTALAAQTADRAAAAQAVRAAEAEVARIGKLGADLSAAGQRVADLQGRMAAAAQAVAAAGAALGVAEEARAAAEAVRGGADPALADTVQRQQLELRQQQARHRGDEAKQRLHALEAAGAAVAEAERAASAAAAQRAAAEAAGGEGARAEQAVVAAREALAGCDRIELGMEVHAATQALAQARGVETEAQALTEAVDASRFGHGALMQQRAAIVTPAGAGALSPMRELHTELAGARGALAVGLVVTVTPAAALELRIARDGGPAEVRTTDQPVEVDAEVAVELGIGPLATVRVRGGRREAQARVAALEARWRAEVVPQLQAAGVEDLDGLDRRIVEARELDHAIRRQAVELEALQGRLAGLAGAPAQREQAEARLAAATAAYGGDVVDAEVEAPEALKRRRAAATAALEAARVAGERARSGALLAQQRAEQLAAEAEAASARRAQALVSSSEGPEGLVAARAAAEDALAAALQDEEGARSGLTALEAAQRDRQQQVDRRLEDALAAVAAAKTQGTRAERELATITGDLRFAEQERERLGALHAAEDPMRAEQELAAARQALAALPVPAREVRPEEVASAQAAASRASAALAEVEDRVLMTRGRLMQVGGAVARERLAAAEEALALAEQAEREVEEEYAAWRLLLDQLRAADAAQASNLGQALAPALSGGFGALTRARYGRVQLAASLSTEGVEVGGAVRPAERLSVGTRDQLSTLYRLALAECLGTAVVLDDQLVQSDGERMAWFRAMLHDKARAFQIVVFTCRPDDYFAGADPATWAVDLASCIE